VSQSNAWTNEATINTKKVKKSAITILLLAGATAAYSQGVINWTDYIPASGEAPGFSITIWQGSQLYFPVNSLGNTSLDLPPGNAPYGSGPYTTPLIETRAIE